MAAYANLTVAPKDKTKSPEKFPRCATIWENGEGDKKWYSVRLAEKTDLDAEYPTVRMVLLDEKGNDVTDKYYVNFRQIRRREESF